MNAHIVFVLNVLATWYLVGLIWMVQVVHYRLYDRVGENGFVRYETDHNRLMTWIVGPPMLIEIVTAATLVFSCPTCLPQWAAWIGLAMVICIWISTFLIQVPCHTTLLNGFHRDAYRLLVNSNWIRTSLWTVRGVLLGYFLWVAMLQRIA